MCGEWAGKANRGETSGKAKGLGKKWLGQDESSASGRTSVRYICEIKCEGLEIS